MLMDRNIYILCLLLTSACIALMLDTFSSVLVILVDILWLVVWLSTYSGDDGENNSKFRLKEKIKKPSYLIACLGVLILMFYVYSSSDKLLQTPQNFEYLMAIFPILLVCNIDFKRGGA